MSTNQHFFDQYSTNSNDSVAGRALFRSISEEGETGDGNNIFEWAENPEDPGNTWEFSDSMNSMNSDIELITARQQTLSPSIVEDNISEYYEWVESPQSSYWKLKDGFESSPELPPYVFQQLEYVA